MTVISFAEARAARGLPSPADLPAGRTAGVAGAPDPLPFRKGDAVVDRCSGRAGRVAEDADASGCVEVYFFPTDRCVSLRVRRHSTQLVHVRACASTSCQL